MALTLPLLGAYLFRMARATLTPTLMLGLMMWDTTWWERLVQWWRPWGDATLLAALTTIVHEALYFGTSRRRCLIHVAV